MSNPLIYSTVFKYTNAADSAKPGYLKKKFDRISRDRREATAKAEADAEAISVEQAIKVHVLGGVK